MTLVEKRLKDQGLKVTPQRVMILEELIEKGHLSIEELYTSVKAQYSAMSLATVYKNIGSLMKSGIVNEVYIPDDKQKYEMVQESHAHFFCKKCGMLKDMPIDEEMLKKGFKGDEQIEDVSLVYSGICGSCKE